MAIAFVNNDVQNSADCKDSDYIARVVIKVDTPITMDPAYVRPQISGPIYSLEIDVRF